MIVEPSSGNDVKPAGGRKIFFLVNDLKTAAPDELFGIPSPEIKELYDENEANGFIFLFAVLGCRCRGFADGMVGGRDAVWWRWDGEYLPRWF